MYIKYKLCARKLARQAARTHETKTDVNGLQ